MTMWQIEENERWRRDPKWDAFFSRVHQLTIITICENSILFYHCLKSWWIRQGALIIQLPTKQSWKSIELCTNLTVSDKLREERSSECAECDSSPWSNWAIQEQWQRTHRETLNLWISVGEKSSKGRNCTRLAKRSFSFEIHWVRKNDKLKKWRYMRSLDVLRKW